MNYSLEDFELLAAEVERQGGTLLPDKCEPQDVHFDAPPYNKDHTEKRVTQGCGHEAIFVFPYDPGPKCKNNAGFARACAVCDAVGGMPRFEKAIT